MEKHSNQWKTAAAKADAALKALNSLLPGALAMDFHIRENPEERSTSARELVASHLKNLSAIQSAFASGHVYCFKCQQSKDKHTHPGQTKQVFTGYMPHGEPIFTDFGQALMDLKDKRYYLAFQKKEILLTRIIPGRDLTAALLKSHGKGNEGYKILSQMILGYLEYKAERIALTIQVIESRDNKRQKNLHVNLISGMADDSLLRTLLHTSKYRHIADALRELEIKVLDFSNSVNRLKGQNLRDKYREIPVYMRELQSSIEKGERQNQRRTTHARLRLEQKRPVANAMTDVLKAGDDSFYHENHSERRVIIGARNRVHIFETDGLHLTSIAMAKTSIENRIKRRRWLPLPTPLIKELRASLHKGQDKII